MGIRRTQSDVWGNEPVQVPAEALYRTRQIRKVRKSEGFKIRHEERLGVLLFLAALAWTLHLMYTTGGAFPGLAMVPGPVHVGGIGTLIWLHAKWRRSVRAA